VVHIQDFAPVVEPEPEPEQPAPPAKKSTPMPEPEQPPSFREALDEPPFEMDLPKPYKYPPPSLLTATRPGQAVDASGELKQGAGRLLSALQNFSIGATIGDVTRGPSVTRYEIELDSGVRLSSLTSRAEDIALALGTVGVNIAPVQGKVNVVGIEVPNQLVTTVYIRELIESMGFQGLDKPTSFVLGRDISGNNIVGDITAVSFSEEICLNVTVGI
jgi:S-DNA-T family DNA segregation ATPase FtsK/SpoIIIE